MKTAVSLLIFLLTVPRYPAATIIDSFSAVEGGNTDSVQTVGSAFGTPVTFTIGPLSTTDPLGGTRRLTVDQFSPGQSAALTVDGAGSAVLSSTGGATSEWKFLYGITFPGLHFNATEGGATAFRLTLDSFSAGLEYVIGASGYTGTGTSNAGTFQPLNSSTIDVPFTSFSNYGNIGFNDLNQIEIRIRDMGLTHGGTASITQFETIVPEPSRAVLLAGACVSFLMRRRRK